MGKRFTVIGLTLAMLSCSGCETALDATIAAGQMFNPPVYAAFSGTGNSLDEAHVDLFNNARASGFLPTDDGHQVQCDESFGTWRCEGNVRGIW